MPKEIKKYYNFMDLSYASTVEQVQEREKVMIKMLRAKAIKKNKSYNEKIDEVVVSANGIIEYIEKNGVPNKLDNLFNTPTKSIISQFIILTALAVVLFCSIYALV